MDSSGESTRLTTVMSTGPRLVQEFCRWNHGNRPPGTYPPKKVEDLEMVLLPFLLRVVSANVNLAMKLSHTWLLLH